MGVPEHRPKVVTEDFRAFGSKDPRGLARRRLAWVVAVTGLFMVVEFAGAAISGSIALLTDAFHMLTHFVATGVSLLALYLAGRPAPPEKSFRYWRIEVLAALFNGVMLLPLLGWVMYKAYQRYLNPEEVRTWVMATAGGAGFVANVACTWILHRGSKSDMNVRAAFLHMLSDTLASIGVLGAAGLMLWCGKAIFDPLFAGLISLLVLVWAVKLILDSVQVLLEAAPRGLKPAEVEEAILEEEGVRAVHDLHIWVITSRMYALTAHVVLDRDLAVSDTDRIARRLDARLDERFDINHTTYQFEADGASRS